MIVGIIGASGQLGSDIKILLEQNKIRCIDLNRKKVDFLFSPESWKIRGMDLDLIINCAAMHDLGEVERDPERAYLINSEAVHNLAKICAENQILLIHISTDYVFDGASSLPYTEDSETNPINVYGESKRRSELIVKHFPRSSIILRVAGLFGVIPPRSKKSNFIDSIVLQAQAGKEIKVVDDIFTSLASTAFVARFILKIINQIDSWIGKIVHVVNSGCASWFAVASEVMRCVDIPVKLEPVSALENISSLARPRYTCLDNSLASKAYGVIPTWQEEVRTYIGNKYG